MSGGETSQSTIVAAGVGATLQLFRFSFDVIATASQRARIQEGQVENSQKTTNDEESSSAAAAAPRRSSLVFFNGRLSTRKSKRNIATGVKSGITADETEAAGDNSLGTTDRSDLTSQQRWLIYSASVLNFMFFVYFLVACILNSTGSGESQVQYDAIPLGCAAVGFFLCCVLNVRDLYRKRFSFAQRTLHLFSSLIFLLGIIFLLALDDNGTNLTTLDIVSLAVFCLFAIMAFLESKLLPYFVDTIHSQKKAKLSKRAIITVLKPYFWPAATATSATLNRIRALTTWACVAASKGCSLLGPIFLGRASTALARGEFEDCIRNSVIYTLCNFGNSFFKESQSLIYLKVAQAAFVQLSEVAFHHLHSLSLDWHLRKKLGEVIRSMDRGILACDTLMKYMFLWLLPALGECILVCVIFATYFDYFALAVTVFFFVFSYIILTIVLTLWRKKFRKQVAKSDNDWHDRATDSLINFETVKYFTAEDYEMRRFGEAVKTYQMGSVNVAASLGILNITQQVLLQACLATALTLATISIRDRANCCVTNGCDDGNSDCCSQLSSVCSGLEIGDFVAVLTYTLSLFTPLNFLGSVYNAIVMAMVDLTNLSELLAESPDVTDAPDAIALPPRSDDTVVEFDNVQFHYPSQPESSGLKGVSFKMKKGTVTAVVGSTGAGKTTVSRLLFRFYDVSGGAVKVNGMDVRDVMQQSLREKIGVVPQATTMFNDTLRENIRYGRRDASQEDLEEVARAAQLSNFIESLPDGWDTMVGDRGLKLSGGEKQRAAIARCLLKNPPIVMLDEATSALDTLTESSVQEALDRLGADRTVLVIAHRLGTIRNADNIIVLDDGRVAEEGTHDELLARGGRYSDMWNMQLNSTRTSQASLGQLTDAIADE